MARFDKPGKKRGQRSTYTLRLTKNHRSENRGGFVFKKRFAIDLADTVKPRLEMVGADCSRVLVIDDSGLERALSDERLKLELKIFRNSSANSLILFANQITINLLYS